MVLETEKIAAMRVPAASALTKVVRLRILHPKNADERNRRLDQSSSNQHAHAVQRVAVAVAYRWWFPSHIEGGLRLGRTQQRKRFLLLPAIVKAGGGLVKPAKRF